MLKRINARGLIAYAHDLIMTAISFVASTFLRLGYEIKSFPIELLVSGAFVFTVIGAVVYWYIGLYRGIWRYASVRDLTTITKAVSLTILIFLFAMFAWTRLELLPRSLPFINLLVLLALLGGPRLAYRIIKDRRLDLKDASDGTRRIPVLLIGAGDGAELFIRSLMRDGGAQYRVVGIIAEKNQRIGQQIHGVPIFSAIENFANALKQVQQQGEKPRRVILTKDTFDGAMVRKILDESTLQGIPLARLPRMTDFKSGDPSQIQIRPIDLEDLLGRPQTALDQAAMKSFLFDRRVLITGAGGSIGSEISRQIAAFQPREILLVDSSEYSLYLIDQELSEIFPEIIRHPIIADVRDEGRITSIIGSAGPDVVFHAAALKHVPLVEYNSCEGVRTNVIGTMNVANACLVHKVPTMVQISTDKAINPTNIMGATKRVAEQYCQALDLNRSIKDETNIVTVRFGNVLGSTGSVVPLFQKQLERGGPLTVTHPEMTRYFMTIREAVELVLLASAIAKPGKEQDGKIFVLDMGEPVKILNLAKQMIHLAGYEPDKDIKIEFSGVRPGEKLFEEVFHGDEVLVPSNAKNIFIAEPRTASVAALRNAILKLDDLCAMNDEIGVRRLLGELVPEASLEMPDGVASS